jgi:signal peptidase I
MIVSVRQCTPIWLLLALVMGGCGTSSAHTASDARASVAVTGSSSSGSGLSYVYRVPSGSMEPTLPLGARVVVKGGRPFVGAIVVYHPPEGSATEECGPKPHVVEPGGAACDAPILRISKIKLIKRVVGGPGDEIYIREGHVYRKADGSSKFVRESDSYIRACGTSPECNFPVPIRIPSGYWFLMGDNRGESNDSRFWGPVPTAWIVALATDHVFRRHYMSIEPRSKRSSFRSQAVVNIVTCLHMAGVTIPPSDSALLSSTSGIKTRSPQVKAVIGRCRREALTASG